MESKELARAKEYALRSLTCRDQTEYQLRQKLMQREYSAETIEAVLLFLKKYHYIDDIRFVEQYIACHCHSLNRRQILNKLYTKGLRPDDIDPYLKQYQYDESALLENAVRKYLRNKSLSNGKEYQKAVMHFLQKGFSASMIRAALQAYDRSNSEVDIV